MKKCQGAAVLKSAGPSFLLGKMRAVISEIKNK